jgi:MinD-like ATPase involved in chromosome partitioning or flagellar assembly
VAALPAAAAGDDVAIAQLSGLPVAHVWAPRPIPQEFDDAPGVEQLWLRAASLRPGCPLVGVSSADGGVGRSTVAAALGALLALACPQPVIAVDMTGRAWGGLGHRVRRSHPGSVWDAVRDVHTFTDRREVQRWVQYGPTGLQALVGEVQMTTARRPPRNEDLIEVVGALRQLYPLAVLDLPPAEVRGTWLALSWAAAPVLVARASTESLRHTMRLVSLLRAAGLGEVADRAVLAVMSQTPSVPREVRAGLRQARGEVGHLVSVPYDPDLARALPVDPRRLHKRTRRALVELAAAVVAGCPADPDLAQALLQQTTTTASSRAEQGGIVHSDGLVPR